VSDEGDAARDTSCRGEAEPHVSVTVNPSGAQATITAATGAVGVEDVIEYGLEHAMNRFNGPCGRNASRHASE